jgi:fatty acid desaturase
MNIELLRLAIDFGLMVLIWMVQLLIYPGFQYLNLTSFTKWHGKYARNMTFIVAPMMFSQVAIAFYFFYNFSGMFVANMMYAVLIALTWVTTFIIFIPIHSSLDKQGYNKSLCLELTRKNWIRVILWTAVVILDFQLLYKPF